jgi:hypothetical protein
MPSYEHKKIIEDINRLDELPPGQEDFGTWIQAGAHLEFLRRNARSDELVIYGSSDYSFVHAAVIANDRLGALRQDDLLHWDGTPYHSIASYVWGGGRDDVWMERLSDSLGSRALDGATQLVFGRTFEGWSGSDRTYFKVNQEVHAYHRHSLAARAASLLPVRRRRRSQSPGISHGSLGQR